MNKDHSDPDKNELFSRKTSTRTTQFSNKGYPRMPKCQIIQQQNSIQTRRAKLVNFQWKNDVLFLDFDATSEKDVYNLIHKFREDNSKERSSNQNITLISPVLLFFLQ